MTGYELSIGKKIFYVVKILFLGVIKPALVKNPNKIREKIHEFHYKKTIEPLGNEINKIAKIGGTSAPFMQTELKKKLKIKAWYYWFVADYYWSKNDFVAGYKSAWYFVLAGDSFDRIGDFSDAGILYHFAGHQFKRVNSLQKAMTYYFKSAEIIYQHILPTEKGTFDLGKRSMHRAIAMAKEIGDEDILHKMIEDSGIDAFNQYQSKLK